MNLLVIGGGGREHAIVRAIRKNPNVDRVFCIPGNDGMPEATPFPIDVMDTQRQITFAQTEHVDFVIVSPDDPLVAGAADAFRDAGFQTFGPSKQAAQLEGSKAFAKAFMQRHHIPTAAYEVFDDAQAAYAYVEDEARAGHLPLVVKADGLALGKGVTIAETLEEAKEAIHRLMEEGQFGDSGREVVIEEFLEGPEVTVLSLTDGHTVVPLLSSMDHKRAYDGDEGPNTGGMGVIAPNPYYTDEIAARCMEEIFTPTLNGMAEEGAPFTGCLYFGLMLTQDGPKVIEYNCRFGDPEAQAVLALLESDLLTALQATTDGTLSPEMVRFADGASCCVILASDGYPLHYEKNLEITIPRDVADKVYAAGIRKKGSTLYTNGGRVVGVVETAPTLEEAINAAYQTAARVTFANKVFRRDIGQRALRVLRAGKGGKA
ncbi:MAG: phosphoribosylamine--glycine ligase [Peptoniphilaceae bacterium]|nr:phosphoribosylamine--glycine ligase [Peptoniphilaceae bacterium]